MTSSKKTFCRTKYTKAFSWLDQENAQNTTYALRLFRELALVLEYVQWRNFAKVLERAILACKNSGYEIDNHFAEVSKIVEAGATSKPIIDYKLTRYACYLLVQNGDPRKEVIALGQTYFAIQTRRQEVADYFYELDEDNKRLVIRGDIKQENLLSYEVHKSVFLVR